jgi:hypothetical protein
MTDCGINLDLPGRCFAHYGDRHGVSKHQAASFRTLNRRAQELRRSA